jgi:hypothetical protein
MDAFRAAGLDGVVFHPRFYPGIPPYMSGEYLDIVADSILYAKETGLIYWIYDENGWPSGTADGQLLARHPASAAVRLDLFDKPQPGSIGSFASTAAGEIVPEGTPGSRTWHMTPRVVDGIDTLNPAVCGQFLDLIHEKYRRSLPAEAFEYVEAFFTDEPESGAIKGPMPDPAGAPWSPCMPEALRRLFGADYVRKLPLLFARGEGFREVRVAYWELVTDLVAKGFFDPYLEWCERHGKKFIGHVKGEEHPLFQLPMVGSCHRIYRHLSMPGIDSLERYPSLDFYPRQAGSVARQFADGRAMVECFGGAGWGAGPEDLERYLTWLARNGLTDFVFHLSQYRLDSAAIRDWPPSEPLHLSWREAFPEVIARVRRSMASNPPPLPDTLVVAPYRGLMADYEPWELMHTNQHVATTYPDTPAGRINRAFLAKLETLKASGVAYDVTDERTLEEDGRQEDGRIRLGRMSYSHLVVADGAIVRGPASAWRTAEPTGIPSVAATPAAHLRGCDLRWTAAGTPTNAWLLEFSSAGDGCFLGTFVTDFRPGEGPALLLRFADDIAQASLDGEPLTLTDTGDGFTARVPGGIRSGGHSLMVRCAREKRHPYVWLEGPFVLLSGSCYGPGPSRTIRTAGPFRAVVAPWNVAGGLIEGGFPFLREPIAAETTITLGAPAASLRFAGTEGDALRVSLDGKALGWAWGPDWTATPAHPIPAGEHRLRVELFPSTFNHLGPHHFMSGDWHVISPDQMVGVKNFADPVGSPDRTFVPELHFKLLRLPQRVGY